MGTISIRDIIQGCDWSNDSRGPTDRPKKEGTETEEAGTFPKLFKTVCVLLVLKSPFPIFFPHLLPFRINFHLHYCIIVARLLIAYSTWPTMRFFLGAALGLLSSTLVVAQTYTDCNPTQKCEAHNHRCVNRLLTASSMPRGSCIWPI